MDLEKLFTLDLPLAEIFVRGTAVYFTLFIVLRLVSKREMGSVGLSDLLVLVLIADAVQNGMAGEYRSITAGLILAGTIIFWATALDLLSFYCPPLRNVLQSPPLMLVKDGVIQARNLRHEYIEEDEIYAEARKAGIEDLAEIKAMRMESDGKFSIIRRKQSKRAKA